MLQDRFGRIINYLRISVTDKCNYRCIYCMPPEGVAQKSHSDMLRYESIRRIAVEAGKAGIRKIRFTGGEPLVKKNIERLVMMVHGTNLFDEIVMTTNGSLLTRDTCRALKHAGLDRVNISLDTLDPHRFRAITRGGDITDVLRGIEEAQRAGLTPVKINMVVSETQTTPEEIQHMRQFCMQNNLQFQTINHFSLFDTQSITQHHHYDRPLPCRQCNRLRLTADGYLKPCLFSDTEIKVDMNDIAQSIADAVKAKPLLGNTCTRRTMNQIGG